MRANLLHVVAAVSNPIRWENRIRLARDFITHMLDSGVQLTVVECAYGDRGFDLAETQHINHIGVRARTLVWNKECLLNIGAQRATNAQYIAFIDADIKFRQKNWASETVEALQLYDVVQPWSDCYDLGPRDEHMLTHRSFCRLWADHKPIVQGPGAVGHYEFGHPGYAWAFTRQALDWVGGLIETASIGAADHHMALALVGRVHDSTPKHISAAYQAPLFQWQKFATRYIAGNISYVPGTIEHMWHGAKDRRKYVDRWSILTKNDFDPSKDLKRNTFGVLELAGNKPELRRDIDAYFRSRNEDANTMSA
jgi:hypothetical protein